MLPTACLCNFVYQPFPLCLNQVLDLTWLDLQVYIKIFSIAKKKKKHWVVLLVLFMTGGVKGKKKLHELVQNPQLQREGR